jgi:tRNA pseudouridine38-40 synthase
MVRAIVGTLAEIGRGWRPVDSIAALLRGGSRADAGPTAPAHGLFLVRVDYD